MRQGVKPTRSELQLVKRRLAVVKRAYKLLKRKQESLMVEFFKLFSEYKTAESDAAAAMEKAKRALVFAEMASGRGGSWSFALARSGRAGIEVSQRGFMGVKLPDLKYVQPKGGAAIFPAEPPQSYRAAEEAEALLAKLVRLAGLGAMLRIILGEIERTKRRVNAIEKKVEPELEEERRFIRLRLEEIERAGLFSLKRLRVKLGASRQG